MSILQSNYDGKILAAITSYILINSTFQLRYSINIKESIGYKDTKLAMYAYQFKLLLNYQSPDK